MHFCYNGMRYKPFPSSPHAVSGDPGCSQLTGAPTIIFGDDEKLVIVDLLMNVTKQH